MLTLDKMLGLLAPHTCLGCGVEGVILCDVCLSVAGEPIAPRCAGCKKLSKGWRTCASCRSWLKADAVVVVAPYDGIYEALIHAYKFDVKREAAVPMSRLIAEQLAYSDYSGFVITPLPTAPARVRMRGFDNGRLLAKSVSRLLELPYTSLLQRQTNSRQLGASRAQRIRQMESELYVSHPDKVVGASILLVDDVMTTGASIAAAAKCLKVAGAKRVSAVVFAQKV